MKIRANVRPIIKQLCEEMDLDPTHVTKLTLYPTYVKAELSWTCSIDDGAPIEDREAETQVIPAAEETG